MLIGIKDVMVLLNVGRPTATRYMQRYLGKARKKNEKYLVSREGFIAWIQGGMQ